MKKFVLKIVNIALMLSLIINFIYFQIFQVARAEENTENVENIAYDYSYCLSESTTETILDEYHSNEKVLAGNAVKLMTIYLIAIEIQKGNLTLEDKLTASELVTGTKGSVVWVEQGDSLTIDELLKAVIIGNANDATLVLAEYFEKDMKKYLENLNKKASLINLSNTMLYSVTGHNDKKSFTTCSDIAILAAKLLEFEFLYDYFSTWRCFIKDNSVELVNENYSLNTVDDAIGLKTGRAGDKYFQILSVKRDTMICTAVVFGCDEKEECLLKAKELVKQGFSNYYVTMPNFSSEYMIPLKVKKGTETAVQLVPENINQLTVQKGSGEVSYIVTVPDYITAPIKKGQRIGMISFYCGDVLLLQTDMIATENIPKRNMREIFWKLFVKML